VNVLAIADVQQQNIVINTVFSVFVVVIQSVYIHLFRYLLRGCSCLGRWVVCSLFCILLEEVGSSAFKKRDGYLTPYLGDSRRVGPRRNASGMQ